MIAGCGYYNDGGTGTNMSRTCPCCGQETYTICSSFSSSAETVQRLDREFRKLQDTITKAIQKNAIKATKTMVDISRKTYTRPKSLLYVKKYLVRKIMFHNSGHIAQRLRKRYRNTI